MSTLDLIANSGKDKRDVISSKSIYWKSFYINKSEIILYRVIKSFIKTNIMLSREHKYYTCENMKAIILGWWFRNKNI